MSSRNRGTRDPASRAGIEPAESVASLAAEKERGNAAQPKQADDSRREEWERQKHQDNVEMVRALNRVADHLEAAKQAGDESESKKAGRERLMIWLVFAALVASVVGDVIFYRTLDATRDAATHAHSDSILALKTAHSDAIEALRDSDATSVSVAADSERHTQAALEKAAQANEIARETSRRQLRAYLSVESLDYPTGLNIENGIVQLQLKLKNSGATPAHDVTVISDTTLFSADMGSNSDLPLPSNRQKFASKGDVGPGMIVSTMDIAGPGGPMIQRRLAETKELIFVYRGVVSYTDEFGGKRFLRFRYCMGGPYGMQGFSQCPAGNEAN